MGEFDNMLNNPLQQYSAPPATTPEQVQAKRSAWSQVLDDPNMKSALFRMGLQMMQGVPQGQTALGATAQAGMDAMDYYGAKNELDRKRAIEDAKNKLDARNTESAIANREANTAQTTQTTGQNDQKFQEWVNEGTFRSQKNELELQRLRNEGKMQEADILSKSFANEEVKRKANFIALHPELADRAMQYSFLKPEADVNLTYAQIGNTEANMRSTDSKMEVDKAEEQRAAEAWASMTPEERKQASLGKKAGATTDHSSDYTDQARSILDEYNRLDPKGKAKYPTVDSFINDRYNVTLGKSASGVLGEVRRLQGMQQSPVSGGDISARFSKDPAMKGYKAGGMTPKGLEVLDAQGKVIGHYN